MSPAAVRGPRRSSRRLAAPPAPASAGSRLPRLLLAGLLALALAACASTTPTPSAPSDPPTAPTSTPGPFPVTLTDDEGGTVELAAEPAAIVSLTPASTEILFALGVGDRIVGNDDFDDFPPEAAEIEPVATYSGVDVEKVVALEPDLVIAGGQGFTNPAAVAKLRSLGIPVLVVYANDIEEVLRDIELIGRAAGRPEAAAAMTSAMRDGIDAIAAATAALPRPRVFYEIDAMKEIYGPADESFVAAMVSLAGGIPITSGSTSVFEISLEKLVEADPEVIVLGDARNGVTPETVAARTAWTTMTAVKTGAVRPVDDTIVTRPGPRLVQGLRALALAIHPDATLPPAPSFPPLGAE